MVAIVLGSGMRNIINYIEVHKQISYDSFIDFDIIPLEGHERTIYEATLNGTSIIILSGKLHLYEGYTYNESISPIQYVSERYRITKWVVTSASGGLSRESIIGEWQEVSSIVSLENIPGLLPITNSQCSKNPNALTYAYQKGPGLGTVAEYKALSKFGADLVGMSMLPEITFLNSIRATSILYSLPVCNYHPIDYDISEPSHKQVIQVANQAISKLVTILSEIIKST